MSKRLGAEQERISGPGRIVNRQELADLFGIVPSTINKWQEIGMPVHRKGSRGIPDQFSSADCLWWRVEYLANPPINDFRLRKLSAEAKLKEHALQRKASQLVPLDWFLDALRDAFAGVSKDMSTIAPTSAPLVAGEDNPMLCRDIINRAVNESRAALSSRKLDP